MYNCTVYVAVFGALAVTTHFQCGDNLQNCSFPWGSGPPPNAGFLGPTRVHNPDGISTGSAGFVGLTLVSSRETYRRHRPRHIDSNRPHLMLCIAMRPNNEYKELLHWIRAETGSVASVARKVLRRRSRPLHHRTAARRHMPVESFVACRSALAERRRRPAFLSPRGALPYQGTASQPDSA